MLPYITVSVCDHCRLRKRRCDRTRPKCSFCVSQGVECVYGQASDSRPSPLVQELMRIRERLEFITPSLEPRLQYSARCDSTTGQNCPPLVLKSPHLMHVFGLPSDLASGLYRLEAAVHLMPVSATELTCVESTDLVFRRFQDQVHQWYPILHSNFTHHFFESNAAGFPYSTISCLSLLVAAIASLVDDQAHSSHYAAAVSMMPIAIEEYSITSVQCLVLFSIYFSCLLQPRQAYDYIHAAFLKIQPFLKSHSFFSKGTPESHLVTRLYWTIYVIMSETAMHLNLPCLGKTLPGGLTTAPLPTGTYMWRHFGDSITMSRSSWSGILQYSEAYSPNETLQPLFNFCTEVNLQQELNGYASSATGGLSTHDDGSPDTERTANSTHPLGALSDTFCSDNGFESWNINGPICRAKYHMYEVSVYWPMIYRIILDGIADAELLPYGALFFESVTSFLVAAKEALWACFPKAWFLCASIYTICFAVIRALEVRCLRLLTEPQLWEYLESSVDTLRAQSELSPSIEDMYKTLDDRLAMAKNQKSQ